MGLFLSMSGVIGCTMEQIQAALAEYAEGHSKKFETINADGLDRKIGVISTNSKNTTIIYPEDFCEWDEVSQFLSEKFDTVVFYFHIHDGDLWMYILFAQGQEVDQFLPLPGYWKEMSEEEKRLVQGNAEIICKYVKGVSKESVRNYLVEWDYTSNIEQKAYPDDEFSIGNCWQVCDFMKKVGFEYPEDSTGEIKGQAFHFVRKKDLSKYFLKKDTPPSKTT